MSDIFDIGPLDKFMCLATGSSGAGKSVAIASWLDKGPIYTFDFDGRMNSVANWYMQRGLKRGQLLYDTYGPDNLYQAMEKLDKFLDYCPFAAISIDSFTAVTISAVTFSLKQRMKKGGQSLPTTSKGDLIIPDFDEYKGETVCVTMMLDFCKSIAAKGIAVFWTAHPITSLKIEGKKYSVQTRYAAYGDKSSSLIPIYFNEVYHFATEFDAINGARKRICLTAPDGEVNAKTALNLPVKINWTDANFYRILSDLVEENKFKGEYSKDEVKKLIETKPDSPFTFTI